MGKKPLKEEAGRDVTSSVRTVSDDIYREIHCSRFKRNKHTSVKDISNIIHNLRQISHCGGTGHIEN